MVVKVGGGLFRAGLSLSGTPAGLPLMVAGAVLFVVGVVVIARAVPVILDEDPPLRVEDGGKGSMDPTPGSNHSPQSRIGPSALPWDHLYRWKWRKSIFVYRVYGLGGGNPHGNWWSFENPNYDPAGYAWRYGLEPYNPATGKGSSGDGWVVGLWDGGGNPTIKPADPAPGYPGSGGGTELYFPAGPGGNVIPIGGGILIPPAVIRSRVKRSG
mgnify:CR=1 FL=1